MGFLIEGPLNRTPKGSNYKDTHKKDPQIYGNSHPAVLRQRLIVELDSSYLGYTNTYGLIVTILDL